MKHTEIGTLIATASGLKLFNRIPIDWLTEKETMKGMNVRVDDADYEWIMQKRNRQIGICPLTRRDESMMRELGNVKMREMLLKNL